MKKLKKLQIYQEFVGEVSRVQKFQDVAQVPHVEDGHLNLGFLKGGCHGDELEKSWNVSR